MPIWETGLWMNGLPFPVAIPRGWDMEGGEWDDAEDAVDGESEGENGYEDCRYVI